MKYKVGDKVVPKSKMGNAFVLEHSAVMRRAKKIEQKYLYIVMIEEAQEQHGCDCLLNENKYSGPHGDFYNFSDLIPYYSKTIINK